MSKPKSLAELQEEISPPWCIYNMYYDDVDVLPHDECQDIEELEPALEPEQELDLSDY